MKAKKLLAMILSLTMILGLCTVGAKAEDDPLPAGAVEVTDGFYQSSATYAESTDFYITNLNGLKYFRDFVNGVNNKYDAGLSGEFNYSVIAFGPIGGVNRTVHLLSDIDLDGEEWTPIGYYRSEEAHTINGSAVTGTGKTRFYANFDGGNHTISNLKFTTATNEEKSDNKYTYGFFGTVQTNATPVTIENLTIENVNIIGGTRVGAIVGNAVSDEVIIQNCAVTGSISVTGNYYVGGIAGFGYVNQFKDCTITGTGTIQANSSVGAITGYCGSNYVVIDNCNVGENVTVNGAPANSENYAGGAEAKIGTKYFGNLTKAIDAAAADATIELLTDIELAAASGSAKAEQLEVAEGKSFTLDGKDHTISFNMALYTETADSTAALFSGIGGNALMNASVTVKDVEFINKTTNATNYSKVFATNNGSTNNFTLVGCTLKNVWSAAYLNGGSGTLTIQNCLYDSSILGGLWSDASSGYTISVTGCEYKAASMEVMNNSSVTITGNDFSAVGTIFVHNGTGAVALNENYWGGATPAFTAADGSTGTIAAFETWFNGKDVVSEPATGADFTLSKWHHKDAVAEVDGEQYLTFAEAMAAVAANGTLTVIKDETENSTLSIGKKINLIGGNAPETTIAVAATGEVTIDSGSYKEATVAEGGKLTIIGGTFATDPNALVADGFIASKLAEGKYVVGPKVVVDSAEDTTSATDAASGVTVTFETEENDKLSTAATGMDENTSLALVIDKKADLTGYAITEATVGEDMTVEDVIDISVKKTTVSSTGTTTEDVPLTEVTATVSYYFPNYNPNKVYKVYYFPEGGGAPVDMKATYNRNTQCFEFTINHNSEYGVVSTEINAGNKTPSIDVVFLPTAKLNVYDIVLKASAEDKYINGFRSADLTFELTYVDVADKVTYVIDPVTGVTTLNDSEAASGRYEFNMDGIHYDRANGNAVKLGTVTFLGYGVIDFIVKTADTNIVNTTKLNDSIVEHYTPSGALGLTINNTGAGTTTASPTAKIDDLTLSPASQALTVNVMFPNNAANNVQAYQDMTMTISGGDLYEDIVIKLGTDASFTGKDYLKHDLTDSTYYTAAPITVDYNNAGSYGATPTACNQYAISIPALLHNGIRYTVTVEGAGYRTMRYSLNMNGDKSVTFWNNVMDADTVIERNILPASDVTSTAVQVTYLAGDIVKDAQINIYDLSAVVSYFGTVNTTSAVSDYAKYDLNRDGYIDSIDVAYVLVSWGK